MSYMVTHTGKQYVFEDPQPSMIDVEDLAHSLANQCRFAGHTEVFYSVAQHCVLASHFVHPKEDALMALLHDASEAYCVDLPRYLKRSPGMEGYLRYEGLAMEAIFDRFGLKLPLPESLTVVDMRLVVTEWRDLISHNALRVLPEIQEDYQPFPGRIYPVEPWLAKKMYLQRFEELYHGF